MGLQGMIDVVLEGCDFDPAEQPLPASADPRQRAGARHHARRAGPATPGDRLGQRARGARGGRRPRPRRWSGLTGTGGAGKSSLTDELVLRFVARLPGQARGGALRRPHEAAHRRRAARRPHPLQHRQAPARLPALARHPRRARRGVRGAARRARDGAGERRLRPDLRRDRRHRPGRQRRRRALRPLALRDDRRVRRADAAREDRDARLRRPGGDQQVHAAAAARTRCATCASSTSATTGCSTPRRSSCRSSAPAPRDFHDPGVNALYGAPRRAARSSASELRLAAAAIRPAPRAPPTPAQPRHPAASASATWRRSPRRCRELPALGGGAGRARRRARGARPRARCWRAPRGHRRGGGAGARRDRRARAPSASACARGSTRACRAAPRRLAALGGRLPRRRASATRCAAARWWSTNYRETLSGTQVPKVARPRYRGAGDRLLWRLLENVPGEFPYTGGVFPFKRTQEDPTRMFAGEGPAERTNRALPLPRRRPAGEAAVDRLRLASPSTARTPTSAPTSTARSARAASRCSPSRRPSSSTPASTSATRRPRCR